MAGAGTTGQLQLTDEAVLPIPEAERGEMDPLLGQLCLFFLQFPAHAFEPIEKRVSKGTWEINSARESQEMNLRASRQMTPAESLNSLLECVPSRWERLSPTFLLFPRPNSLILRSIRFEVLYCILAAKNFFFLKIFAPAGPLSRA